MPRVLFESEVGYRCAVAAQLVDDRCGVPGAKLVGHAPSQPTGPAVITANGRNIPWLALELKREGLPKLRLLTIAVSAMPTGLPMCKPRCPSH